MRFKHSEGFVVKALFFFYRDFQGGLSHPTDFGIVKPGFLTKTYGGLSDIKYVEAFLKKKMIKPPILFCSKHSKSSGEKLTSALSKGPRKSLDS